MTRLAYVRTGLRDVDDMSRAGLVGLGLVLEQLTTIETRDPVAVDTSTRRSRPVSVTLLANIARTSANPLEKRITHLDD
ncbi:MAG: hypothetical protein R3D03_15675 [Geminicoccaceae bacterium]